MTFCPRRIVSTIGSVRSGFCLRVVLSTWGLSLWVKSIWIPSTWESGHMKFCPPRIVSTFAFVNSGFCQRLVLSSLNSVQLGVCRLEFCPSWESSCMTFAHIGLRLLLDLSTLDLAQMWFSLLGSLSTVVFVYMESVFLGVWPHDILPA